MLQEKLDILFLELYSFIDELKAEIRVSKNNPNTRIPKSLLT